MLAGAVVAVAGCGGGGGSPGELTGEQSSADSTQNGVDYSWDRPSPSSLKSDGYKFVCRYLSHDTTGKNLSKSEADALIAEGIGVVSNWEDSSTDALSGYDLGVSDAKAADSQDSADGAPSTRPIYFSVDFDATPGDQTAINAYFDGVASVIGLDRTGAYGGYYVIQRLFDAGKIKWGWQTYAWSGGQWDSRAQLRQVQNGIAGGQMDLDQAVADDFGQWGADLAVPPDQPKGYLDSATCTTVSGWTQDPAVPTTSINADVYYDGAAGASGATGIRLTANVSRQDLCKAIGSCDHGYSMAMPRSLLDEKAHDVYAYGINHTAGGVNTLLTGSPKSITCAAPSIAAGSLKRHVVNPTILSDWKFDTFLDMAPYSTAELTAVADGADLASAPALVQASGDPAVYVVDGAYKRHVVNPDSFTAWRFASADVKSVTAADLDAIETGADWPATPLLVKDPSDPAVYVLDVRPEIPSSGPPHVAAGLPVAQPEGESETPVAEANATGGSGAGCSVSGSVSGAPSSSGVGWLAFAGALLVPALSRRGRRSRRST
ncbi:MAG TPA: DUF1906 domain-containing protein [Polyangiaceae bacterium]